MCGLLFGSTCPIFGAPRVIEWAEYENGEKTVRKGRWCALDTRVVWSYGEDESKATCLTKKNNGDETFVKDWDRRRETLIVLCRNGESATKDLHSKITQGANELKRAEEVKMREQTAKVMKPRGKLATYTDESYKTHHQGRSLEEDGYVAGMIEVEPGRVIKGVQVWEGPMDVWETETRMSSIVDKERSVNDNRVALAQDQVQRSYQHLAAQVSAAGMGRAALPVAAGIVQDEDDQRRITIASPGHSSSGAPKQHSPNGAGTELPDSCDPLDPAVWEKVLQLFKDSKLEDKVIVSYLGSLKSVKVSPTKKQKGASGDSVNRKLEIGSRSAQVKKIQALLKAYVKVQAMKPGAKKVKQLHSSFASCFDDLSRDLELEANVPAEISDKRAELNTIDLLEPACFACSHPESIVLRVHRFVFCELGLRSLSNVSDLHLCLVRACAFEGSRSLCFCYCLPA